MLLQPYGVIASEAKQSSQAVSLYAFIANEVFGRKFQHGK
jgi:hypothetical protein